MQLHEKQSRRMQKYTQNTFLHYSIGKFSLQVPLNFPKLRKPRVKIAILLVFLYFYTFSFIMCNSNLYCVCEYYAHQMTIHRYWGLGQRIDKEQWRATAPKLSPTTQTFLFGHALLYHVRMDYMYERITSCVTTLRICSKELCVNK